jgi:hypothetical protein
MTRLRNWFKNKSDAMKAWKERSDRLSHCVAEIKTAKDKEKIGYYVGRIKDINNLDNRRYLTSIVKKCEIKKCEIKNCKNEKNRSN